MAMGLTGRWARAVPLWAAILIWTVTYLACRAVLDRDGGGPASWKLIAALVPVIPTAFALWRAQVAVGELDELQRRVHLEALVIAFPLTALLLMTLGLLQLAVELPVEDWSYRHVWAALPIFYGLGLGISWSRYR
jgi:hypothetical protein